MEPSYSRSVVSMHHTELTFDLLQTLFTIVVLLAAHMYSVLQ